MLENLLPTVQLVQLTSCLTGLDQVALLTLHLKHIHFTCLGGIQTSQTGGQLYSDTFQ